MIRTIKDKFNSNVAPWTLSNATISGGLLNITAGGGYGQRSPDVNWYAGANDDFILEFDWKCDTDVAEMYYNGIWLIGDATPIYFVVLGTTNDKYIIYYGANKALGDFNPVAGTWYTARIRRVGTTYYFRATEALGEISWNYGTARAINYFRLEIRNTTGNYDNFKYYPVEIGFTKGVGNPLIL